MYILLYQRPGMEKPAFNGLYKNKQNAKKAAENAHVENLGGMLHYSSILQWKNNGPDSLYEFYSGSSLYTGYYIHEAEFLDEE